MCVCVDGWLVKEDMFFLDIFDLKTFVGGNSRKYPNERVESGWYFYNDWTYLKYHYKMCRDIYNSY